MPNFLRRDYPFLLLLVMAVLCLCAVPLPGHATTGLVKSFTNDGNDTIRPVCDAEATTGQTYATTSYADVTLAACTFVPLRNDPTGAGLQGAGITTDTTTYADQIEVSYSVDAIKATTTTGTCAVYANAGIIANSARTMDVAAKNGVLSWRGYIPNSTIGSQTIKLQCKSGDTAVFTVNFAHLVVNEVVRAPLRN